ncbi:MAG: hypothetical protein L0H70_05370, partial [Xanthomonadales bacterium]|nr:hypothetical protein [Xanthomonadales bacterium]
MLLRIMIAVGLLGLAGCVTTPDYRYTTVADGYGNSSNGYYTDDGYYGDSNASVGYYDGYDNGGGYLTSTWGASPWFGYGSGWGMGYANYGPYGFTPGWGSYYGSGWGLGFGSYWGSYAYSPFFPFYGFPYWYNNYPQQEHHHRRDLSAVRAEQLR